MGRVVRRTLLVDRRTFLLASATFGLAAACGGDDEGASASPERSRRVELLVPTFPDGFGAPSMLVAGIPQRITFVVRDDTDVMRTDAPDELEIAVTFEGEAVAVGPVTARRDGIITPYYAIELTAPDAGRYTASTPGADPVEFLVEDRPAVPIVQVGDPMRSVATPTSADPLGVTPICTRAEQCPFHEISLDDALTTGRPTVLLVATPGYCQSDSCGPVVDLLIDAAAGRDDVNVIHGEVYVDPSEFATGAFPETTPVVETYSLPYEPQLVVGDTTGTVASRLDYLWDRTELAAALAAIS